MPSSTPIPENKKLYAQVKEEADLRFLAPTSAYKSAWIVKTYKDRGGTYAKNTSCANPKLCGLRKWFAEKWVNLAAAKPGREPPPCGRAHASIRGAYPVCRPMYRVTKDTPVTVGEFAPTRIKAAMQKKQKVKQRGRVLF